jgi:hypothetical protein
MRQDVGQVSFQWKDYRDANRSKVMTVSADEFIRRFLQHALPPGFQRIRYHGFLANCHRAAKLDLCRQLLATVCSVLLPQPADCRDFLAALTAGNLRLCPQCGIGALMQMKIIPLYFRLRSAPRGQLMTPSGWNPQSRQRCLPGRVRSTCVPHRPHSPGTPFQRPVLSLHRCLCPLQALTVSQNISWRLLRKRLTSFPPPKLQALQQNKTH